MNIVPFAASSPAQSGEPSLSGIAADQSQGVPMAGLFEVVLASSSGIVGNPAQGGDADTANPGTQTGLMTAKGQSSLIMPATAGSSMENPGGGAEGYSVTNEADTDKKGWNTDLPLTSGIEFSELALAQAFQLMVMTPATPILSPGAPANQGKALESSATEIAAVGEEKGGARLVGYETPRFVSSKPPLFAPTGQLVAEPTSRSEGQTEIDREGEGLAGREGLEATPTNANQPANSSPSTAASGANVGQIETASVRNAASPEASILPGRGKKLGDGPSLETSRHGLDRGNNARILDQLGFSGAEATRGELNAQAETVPAAVTVGAANQIGKGMTVGGSSFEQPQTGESTEVLVSRGVGRPTAPTRSDLVINRGLPVRSSDSQVSAIRTSTSVIGRAGLDSSPASLPTTTEALRASAMTEFSLSSSGLPATGEEAEPHEIGAAQAEVSQLRPKIGGDGYTLAVNSTVTGKPVPHDSQERVPSLTKEATFTKDKALTKEAAVTNDGASTKEATFTNDGALTKEAAVTKDGALTKEAAVTKDGALTKEAAVTGPKNEVIDPPSVGSSSRHQSRFDNRRAPKGESTAPRALSPALGDGARQSTSGEVGVNGPVQAAAGDPTQSASTPIGIADVAAREGATGALTTGPARGTIAPRPTRLVEAASVPPHNPSSRSDKAFQEDPKQERIVRLNPGSSTPGTERGSIEHGNPRRILAGQEGLTIAATTVKDREPNLSPLGGRQGPQGTPTIDTPATNALVGPGDARVRDILAGARQSDPIGHSEKNLSEQLPGHPAELLGGRLQVTGRTLEGGSSLGSAENPTYARGSDLHRTESVGMDGRRLPVASNGSDVTGRTTEKGSIPSPTDRSATPGKSESPSNVVVAGAEPRVDKLSTGGGLFVDGTSLPLESGAAISAPVQSSLRGPRRGRTIEDRGILDAEQRDPMVSTKDNKPGTELAGKNMPNSGRNDSPFRVSERLAGTDAPNRMRLELSNDRAANLSSANAILEGLESVGHFGEAVDPAQTEGLAHARLAERIFTAVESFRTTGSNDWVVRIRPDQETELNLRLRLQENQLVVQARLDRGSWDAVASSWPDLQAQLASRGVHLQGLESATAQSLISPNSSSMSSEGFGQRNHGGENPRSQELHDLNQMFQLETSERRKPQLTTKPASSGNGWESWA